MSLREIRDAIIGQLGAVAGAKTVEPFAGDLDALFRDTSQKPGLHLLYAGSAYGEQETLGGPVQPVPTRRIWTVLVVVAGRKSTSTTEIEAMELIDQVREELSGFVIGDDHLWPLADEFLKAKNGVLVYGVDFYLETEE